MTAVRIGGKGLVDYVRDWFGGDDKKAPAKAPAKSPAKAAATSEGVPWWLVAGIAYLLMRERD